jgi:hypothetical protein
VVDPDSDIKPYPDNVWVLVVKRSPRQRLSSYAIAVGFVVLSFGVPLIVVGAVAHIVAFRDAGFALIVLALLVMAVVFPVLFAKRRRHSRQLRSGNPQPS